MKPALLNENSDLSLRRELGGFIREARQRVGLSVADAASAIDFSPEELLKAEAGLVGFQLIEICAFSNLYNIDPDEFLRKLHLVNFHLFDDPDSGA